MSIRQLEWMKMIRQTDFELAHSLDKCHQRQTNTMKTTSEGFASGVYVWGKKWKIDYLQIAKFDL